MVLFLLAVVTAGAFPNAQSRASLPAEYGKDLSCTVVEPVQRVTLEVTIPDSFEYCPMLARALSEDVLHRRVGIMASRWHYPNAVLSCRLHQHPPDEARRITVHNSRQACRWLVLSGWLPKARRL